MIAGQLAFRFGPAPTLTLTALREVGIRPAVFYYACRELASGRPCPVKLTGAQLEFVERFL